MEEPFSKRIAKRELFYKQHCVVKEIFKETLLFLKLHNYLGFGLVC